MANMQKACDDLIATVFTARDEIRTASSWRPGGPSPEILSATLVAVRILHRINQALLDLDTMSDADLKTEAPTRIAQLQIEADVMLAKIRELQNK